MFYLLRHGQTEFNIQKRLQGGSDSPLTSVGVQQARNLGLALRKVIGNSDGWILDSSPLPRARATAAIVREAFGPALPLRFDDRLREVSLGSWEGLTDEEIEREWPSACIKD
jgi:probable phosphoglycerate mutase